MEYRIRDINIDEIRPAAQAMREKDIMLIMIHGYMDKENNPVIQYEYQLEGYIESLRVTGEKALPTISDIYSEAAAWPERELNELIGVDFTGLDTSKRLFLPEDMLEEKGQILVNM